jgi:maleate cis-trans isomerase
MTIEYAARGLVGVLTPQANTTVEPELAILAPPGIATLAARLCSAKRSMNDRLLDYFDALPGMLAEFANAPIAACGFACTGAAYLAGPAREAAAMEELSARAGWPMVTATGAIADALQAIGAQRIALVSPYDVALEADAIAYWQARGFGVIATHSVFRHSEAFHPIYSLPSGATRTGIDLLGGEEADAIVVLGTGLPSLVPIAATPRVVGKPVLSSTFCLAWRLFALAGAWPSDAAGLHGFLDDPGWRARLAAARG